MCVGVFVCGNSTNSLSVQTRLSSLYKVLLLWVSLRINNTVSIAFIEMRRQALIIVVILVLLNIINSHSLLAEAIDDDLAQKGTVATRFPRLQNLLASFKKTSRQGLSVASNLLSYIPFGRILLAGGALLSLFFIFLRLLVVLGPILLLGALTRESTNATDLFRLLIEFYNEVIMALDQQMSSPNQVGSGF